MMDSVVYWFKTEVFFWRSAGSLFWSLVCLPPLTVLFVFFSQTSLLQPWQALQGFLSVVFSLSFPLWLALLVAVLVAVANTAVFTVVPDVPATRLQSCMGLLRWSRLPHLLVSMVGGKVVTWCCSHFMDQRFQGLTSTVHTLQQEVLVMNERHLMLVVCGAMAGLTYYINFYLGHLNHLAFPTLQRDKYFRVCSELLPLTKRCLHMVWQHIRIFYLGYWLFGGTYRSWVMAILRLEALQEERLDSVAGLLDVGLLWQLSLLSFFLFYTWCLSAVLYRVYHTERLEIALVPPFSSSPKHCLPEALASSSTPLLQHLAFLDLSVLSGGSPPRRAEVFSLSQPGGHPHTWRAVLTACLSQLHAFTAQVHAAHLSALAALPMQHLPAEKIFSTVGAEVAHASTTIPPSTRTSFGAKLYAGLKSKPVLSYFLMELPDSKSRQLFASCQTQIWAIEAVSQLAAASYREDQYGVVQPALSTIFSSLIALQDNIEKYFKLQPLSVKRSGRDGQWAPHVSSCQQLPVTLKTALYRLTNTFGHHLTDLHLTRDCLKRVRPFLDYKE